MVKKWETINKLKIKNKQSLVFQTEKLKVGEIIKILLENRGIKTKAQEKEFFNPTHPDKLKIGDFGISTKELKKAISRILWAKKNGERVIVWGDYDTDGICGAAILWEALYYHGVNALPFIPERRTEGYGLNVDRMKQLKKEDPSVGLIITVDNGIVAHEKVETAKKLGFDIIITDHHLPRKTRPKAYAILHTTKISGAGVAYLLAREFQISNFKFQIDDWSDWLGLVALATVADMVPIVGVARSLVYHGLLVLQKTKRPGILALCQIARINQQEIGTYEIGFMLAPRLNAMGRLEHAMESLRLLCTKSKTKAQDLAFQLNKTNISRQKMVLDAVLHAREQVIATSDDGLIFISHESYHEGIVGLVASRLVEEFGRPAIVVSKGEELSRGSARSVPGFNIVQLIEMGREFLVEGGGHTMAAGFTVKTAEVSQLESVFAKNAVGMLNDGVGPKILIDIDLPFESATLELAKQIEKFAPFGVGNQEPVFVTRGVEVVDARLVGNVNQHLKFRVTCHLSPVTLDAIAFNMCEVYSKLSPEKPIDIVYNLDLDKWPRPPSLRPPETPSWRTGSGVAGGNGSEKLQLKIRDINPNP